MKDDQQTNIARDWGRKAADGSLLHQEGDLLVTATAFDGQVRAIALTAKQLVETARQRHDLSPLATAALGRLLMGNLLLAHDLKGADEEIALNIKADGPINGLFTIAKEDGSCRGYVGENHVESLYHSPGKLNVGAAVGKGNLNVSRSGGAKDPYTGQVALISGEIAEDINYYLAISEQIPSVVALGVQLTREGVSAAGGLLLQLLPGASDRLVDYLEKRAGGFPDVSFLVSEGFDAAELMDLFLGDPQIEYLSTRKLQFHCSCSRDRMVAQLLALGQEELRSLAKDEKGAELICHYCAEHYSFSQEELELLWQKL